jgi:large subunit ribosomal protein L54
MPGLSVLKDKPDPVALADEEYPAWLWAILDGEVAAKKKEGEFDFLTERKRLRAA